MKIFNFNPEQHAALVDIYQSLSLKLIDFAFQDPAEDGANIRRHAYLKGKQELVGELLRDEWPSPQREPIDTADATAS